MVVTSDNSKFEDVLVKGPETLVTLVQTDVINKEDGRTIVHSRSLLERIPLLINAPLRLPSKPGRLQIL